MRGESSVLAVIVFFVLFLSACVVHPDSADDESAKNQGSLLADVSDTYGMSNDQSSDDAGASRFGDTPINQEEVSETVLPGEVGPKISKEDIERIDLIPLEDILGYSEEEAKEVLDKQGIEIGARELIDACLFGSRKLSLLLLTSGVDPNEKTEYGGYPISAAFLGGNVEIISDIIERGVDLNVTQGDYGSPCIHLAAQSGNTKAVDLILDYGAVIDDRDVLDQTTLMKICEMGMGDMAEYLVSLGANVNAKDELGLTPLHWAVRSGLLPIVKMLVEHGADINAKDDAVGMSSVFSAAMTGHVDVFKYLLDAGAELQEETNNHINIIHAASLAQSREIVQILLDRGSDINVVCPENGGTPILAALDRLEVDPEFIRFLIQLGADVNVFDINGASPLTMAAVGGHVEVFHDLINAGADCKAVNQMGVPALHIVIMNDNAEMVQTMVDLGVDLYAKDNEGKTALDRSIEYSCDISESVLREAMGLPPRVEEVGSENAPDAQANEG